MRKSRLGLLAVGFAQTVAGVVLLGVTWWASVADHYVAWDRLSLAFQAGVIEPGALERFAGAKGFYCSTQVQVGPEAPVSANKDAEQFLVWMYQEERLARVGELTSVVLAASGLLTLVIGWFATRPPKSI